MTDELIIISHSQVSAKLQEIISIIHSNTDQAEIELGALKEQIDATNPKCARGDNRPSLVGLYVNRAVEENLSK